MDVWSEKSYYFEQSTMFTKSKFCKLYTVTNERPSGQERHSHDYMQIWYITKGKFEHWVEGKKHLMTRGDIFIVPPQIEHSTRCMEDSETLCCEFSFDHFFPSKENSMYHQIKETTMNLSFVWLFLQDTDDVQSQFSLSSETGKRVSTLMHEMLREYEEGVVYYEEFLRVQIMELLLLLAREYSLSPASNVKTTVYDKYKPLVVDSIRYVDEHFAESIKLEDVCRVSMVSKTYFCYLFKLITQQTFVEYIMNLRIQKAIELLEDSSYAITSIAYEVGFNDSTHFSRTFKKVVGISPRTYRAIKNN